jgi:hypothetical protein
MAYLLAGSSASGSQPIFVRLWGAVAFIEPGHTRAVRGPARPALVPPPRRFSEAGAVGHADGASNARYVVFNVALDFAPVVGKPTGGGEFTGERMRRHLLRVLQIHEAVVVDLDDVEGYTWDFLDEAFGGLVRVAKLPVSLLRQKLSIRSMDSGLVNEIWRYVERAAAGSDSIPSPA